MRALPQLSLTAASTLLLTLTAAPTVFAQEVITG
jgi:hypothetical protein